MLLKSRIRYLITELTIFLNFYFPVHSTYMLASQLRSSLFAWSALDKLGCRTLSGLDILDGKHHALVDYVVGSVRQRNIFHQHSFFEDGWGEVDSTSQLAKSWFSALKGHDANTWQPTKIDIKFGSKSTLARGVNVQECTFETSAREISHLLPKESLEARFLLVTPDNNKTPGYLGPTALLLAGKGEHSFARRCLLAVPLAQRSGITSIVLESPYYGKRRPRTQPGSKLRQVADLAKLGKTTIEEASSLIQYFLTDNALSSDVCVAGVSMGGLHSAMTASVFPKSVGMVSWLGPPSAVPVFTQGLLSRYCEWTKLQEQLSAEDVKLAQDRMRQALEFSNISNFPQPVDPTRAVFVVGKNDLFIPYSQAQEWWRQTLQDKWKGCRVEHIPGGHVTGTLLGTETMRTCIEQTLGVHRRVGVCGQDPFARFR